MGGKRTLLGLFQEWDLAVEVYMRSPAIQGAFDAEYQQPRLMATLKASPQPPPGASAFIAKAFEARATGQCIQHAIDSRWIHEARRHLAAVCQIRDDTAAATGNDDDVVALEAELTNVLPEDRYVVDGD